MSRYEIAPLAQSDLAEAIGYITLQNPNAAERLRVTIMEAVERLAAEPGIGHARPDLTPQRVRFWTVSGRYTIVYREASAMIEIVRVFGPGRNVAALLS